jgi:hypothetical protein
MFAPPNDQITTSARCSLTLGSVPLKVRPLLTFPSPPLPLPPKHSRKNNPLYSPDCFTYLPETIALIDSWEGDFERYRLVSSAIRYNPRGDPATNLRPFS